MRRTPAALIALVGLSAAALAGCSDKAEPATTAPATAPATQQSQTQEPSKAPSATADQTKADETKGGAAAGKGETESVTVGDKTVDAPKGLTFPEGMKADSVTAAGGAGQIMASAPSLEDIVTFYGKKLPELGYKITAQSPAGLVAEGNGYTLVVSTAGGQTMIAWSPLS